MTAAVDAVVVGAGPNGLVAANRLADAGWSVLLIEQQDRVGGACRSDREVHPDFVHDTFSAFYPLGVASPAIASLDLPQHGLVWTHAPAVVGHPLPDGTWGLLHRQRELTAAGLEAAAPGDGEAWLDLCRAWDVVGPSLVRALMTPFPPVRAGAGLLARLPRVGGLGFVRMLLEPAVHLAESRFRSDAARALLLGNAGHADIPLDAPGSGLMGVLMAMLGQHVGFPVPEGGAGRLTEVLAQRLQARGGQIRCGTAVVGIEVADGRAVAVRLDDGSRVPARRAVLADVVAPALYEQLLDPADVPPGVARGIRQFDWDPGTVKVDWALDGPVPWAVRPSHLPGTVHLASSTRGIHHALSQVSTGCLPADPFLLAGQMTTTDPTRSPPGTESMWAYTHVPQHVREDAGDGSVRGTWDDDDCQRFADRMQAQVERYAPDFASRIIARRVLGPRQLQERDANLVGGAINGGTTQLHQQLVFRPTPGLGRAETAVRGLFLASASAHPGGGVHGACGANAARAALAHARLGRLGPSRTAAAVPRPG